VRGKWHAGIIIVVVLFLLVVSLSVTGVDTSAVSFRWACVAAVLSAAWRDRVTGLVLRMWPHVWAPGGG